MCCSGVGRQLQVEPLEEEGEERTKLPLVSFDYVFLTPENADIFPILMCREHRLNQTIVTCCERKDPTPYLISFLVDRRILWKDKNELKRNEETILNSQDFDWTRHKCEDHR